MIDRPGNAKGPDWGPFCCRVAGETSVSGFPNPVFLAMCGVVPQSWQGDRCAPPVASPRPWCGSGIEPHPHHRTVSPVHHSRVLEIYLSTRTGPWRNVRRFIALKAGRSSPSLRTPPDRRAAAGPQGKGRPLPLPTHGQPSAGWMPLRSVLADFCSSPTLKMLMHYRV